MVVFEDCGSVYRAPFSSLRLFVEFTYSDYLFNVGLLYCVFRDIFRILHYIIFCKYIANVLQYQTIRVTCPFHKPSLLYLSLYQQRLIFKSYQRYLRQAFDLTLSKGKTVRLLRLDNCTKFRHRPTCIIAETSALASPCSRLDAIGRHLSAYLVGFFQELSLYIDYLAHRDLHQVRCFHICAI